MEIANRFPSEYQFGMMNNAHFMYTDEEDNTQQGHRKLCSYYC
jgi:hypothetical protein